jgi:hypothetical protein
MIDASWPRTEHYQHTDNTMQVAERDRGALCLTS